MEENPNLMSVVLILGRVEGKLDGLKARNDAADEKLKDHETRISNIETLVHKREGRLSVYSLLWGVALAASAGAGFLIEHFWMTS